MSAARGPKALAKTAPGKGLNLNDLVDLEDLYGPIDQIDWSRMRVMRTVIWCVYRHDEPAITETEAGARIDQNNIAEEAGRILARSGITSDGETPQGNAPAPSGATQTGS